MSQIDGVAAEDQLVVSRLREMLKEVDLDTCTERQLRERLEGEFSVSLKDKKDLVRKEIEDFLLIKSAEDDLHIAKQQSKKRGKARHLSPQMRKFMGVDSASWQDVTSTVWKYIRQNNLQSPEDRRNINLDAALGKIFKEPLSMFNLSQQLSHHILDDADRNSKAAKTAPAKTARKKTPPTKGLTPGKKRKTTGFTRKLQLSDQLRDSLGLRDNENINRGELSKKFWDYFRRHELQDPSDRRWILCDDNLKALLGTERFQAFAIQKLCKHHILGYLDDAHNAVTLSQDEILDPEIPADGETEPLEEATPTGDVEMAAANNESPEKEDDESPEQEDDENPEKEDDEQAPDVATTQVAEENQSTLESEQTPGKFIPESDLTSSGQVILETQFPTGSEDQGDLQQDEGQQDLQGGKQGQEIQEEEEATDQNLFTKENDSEPVVENNQKEKPVVENNQKEKPVVENNQKEKPVVENNQNEEPVVENNQNEDDTEQDIYAELLQQIDEDVAGS